MKKFLLSVLIATIALPSLAYAISVPWQRPSAGIIHNLFIGDNVGVGSTSPTAKFSVHGRNGETNTQLFAVASSTASATSTLFSVGNAGGATVLGDASNPFIVRQLGGVAGADEGHIYHNGSHFILYSDEVADSTSGFIFDFDDDFILRDSGTVVWYYESSTKNWRPFSNTGGELEHTTTGISDPYIQMVVDEDTGVGGDGADKGALVAGGNTILTFADDVGDEAVLINPAAATDIGLTVQGATSQSAALQEWQNSAGTVLGSIGSNGALTLTSANASDTMLTVNALTNGSTAADFNGGVFDQPVAIFDTQRAESDSTAPIVHFIRGGDAGTVGATSFAENRYYSRTTSGSAQALDMVWGWTDTTHASRESAVYWDLYDSGGASRVLTATSNNRFGVGTSSPYAQLSVHANNGETNTTLFAVGSSTASATTTLFSVGNTGNLAFTGALTGTGAQVNFDPDNDGSNELELDVESGSRLLFRNPIGNDFRFVSNADAPWFIVRSAGVNVFRRFTVAQDGTNTILTVSDSSDEAVLIQPDVATDIGLTVQGATSQSANLQEWQNSAGTALLSVDANGDIVSSQALEISIPTNNTTAFVISENGNDVVVYDSLNNMFGTAIGTSGFGFPYATASLTVPTAIPYRSDSDTGLGGDGSDTGALIAGGSTAIVFDKTGVNVNVGVGTTSPHAKLSVHANNGETNTRLFSVASSTASATTTHFYINNEGEVFMPSIRAELSSLDAMCYDTTTGEIEYNSGAQSCTVSSARYKDNITEYASGLATVLKLDPVSFTDKRTQTESVGLIAEDVEQVDDRLVFYEEDGQTVRGVHYENLTAVLADAVQTLHRRILAVYSKVKSNEGRIERLERENEELRAELEVIKSKLQ